MKLTEVIQSAISHLVYYLMFSKVKNVSSFPKGQIEVILGSNSHLKVICKLTVMIRLDSTTLFTKTSRGLDLTHGPKFANLPLRILCSDFGIWLSETAF